MASTFYTINYIVYKAKGTARRCFVDGEYFSLMVFDNEEIRKVSSWSAIEPAWNSPCSFTGKSVGADDN
jgi:hypothetical protein